MRNGESVLKKSFNLTSGETVSLTIPTTSSPDTSSPEPPKPDNKRLWTWVAFGVGGAAAVGFGITGGLARARKSDLVENCAENSEGTYTNCPPDTLDSAEKLAVSANVLLGVALTGVATGVVLWFMEPKMSGERSALRITPAVGHHGAGATLQGRF